MGGKGGARSEPARMQASEMSKIRLRKSQNETQWERNVKRVELTELIWYESARDTHRQTAHE